MQGNHSLLWLKHLDLVKQEFLSTLWPRTAEEGMRQVLQLSARGWKQLIADLVLEHPKASPEELEHIAYRLVTEWADARRNLSRNESTKGRRVQSNR